MIHPTSRTSILAALSALSLSISLSACGPPPTSQPGPSPSPGATVSPGPSVAPSATPDTASSQDLTVTVKADASLAGFAIAQQSNFTLCLGQIASAATRLTLPASLPDAALNALRS